MKWIDTPPVWLLGFLVLAWLQSSWAPTPFPDTLGDDVGGLCLLAALFVFVAAVTKFRRHRTTLDPHGAPTSLITEGIYARSRNPIYLADVLLLVGFSLLWSSVLGLVLVPAFVWILGRRFIAPEEARLSAAFGPAFDAYARDTRRWM